MPADLLKRINLDLLYAPFLEKVFQLLANCQLAGKTYYGYSGYRTFAEQFQLHQSYLNGTGGRAAPAGLSAHQYGLAIDFAFDKDPAPGLQSGWDRKDYECLGAEAKKLGLVWGGDFNDWVHVQWPGYVDAFELDPLRKEWARVNMGPSDVQKKAALVGIWNFIEAAKAQPAECVPDPNAPPKF